ncbi:MAG: tRNA lysidine(34) synthetase TilS [Candidatus Dactylopiibacterium sp.]|nr:tRNA lysidine(34) synthetase TilS [Candidatus Dactylopiibacterium sp.]
MSRHFRSEIEACWPPGRVARVAIGYSGGVDSTVLLHALADLREARGFALEAVHIHHGLSPFADAWATHCQAGCDALGVPLRIVRVQPIPAGKGLEAAARAARHAVFAALDVDWIALAHHADDQAETLLQRLVRGTGVAGAAAMRPLDAARRLWRPLLAVRRADILGEAHAQGLAWIEDESNADTHFLRNFLRHQILAPLDARLPAANANLLRACAHFAEADALLTEVSAGDAEWIGLARAGARTRWRSLGEARQRNLLRHWLREDGAQAPDAARTRRLCARLAGTAAVRERVGERALCAAHERIWFEPAVLPVPAPLGWHGERELAWGAGLLRCRPGVAGGLRVDASAPGLEFRPRAGGEHLRLAAARPTRTLRQLCQEADLPAWWRDGLPLLWQGDRLLWAGGIGAAAAARATADESGWAIEWVAPDGLAREA